MVLCWSPGLFLPGDGVSQHVSHPPAVPPGVKYWVRWTHCQSERVGARRARRVERDGSRKLLTQASWRYLLLEATRQDNLDDSVWRLASSLRVLGHHVVTCIVAGYLGIDAPGCLREAARAPCLPGVLTLSRAASSSPRDVNHTPPLLLLAKERGRTDTVFTNTMLIMAHSYQFQRAI